jgi:hypothetical protein
LNEKEATREAGAGGTAGNERNVSQRRKPKAPPSRDPDLRSAAEARLGRSRATARELEAKPAREIVHEL